jgi:Uma2 family endonuclease
MSELPGGIAVSATSAELIPLESGDRLTRAEFHRRYCARPDIKKAELIEGVVYVASPVRHSVHVRQHGIVMMWLSVFAANTPGVDVTDNATLFISPESELQPDACLYRVDGGGVRLTDDGYLDGTPELVVEVAASSASYDLHDKKEVYRRAGVPEYIAWQVLEVRIDWFRLREGAYVPLVPDAHGMIISEVFPRLRLAVAKMLACDRAGVLAELPPRA